MDTTSVCVIHTVASKCNTSEKTPTKSCICSNKKIKDSAPMMSGSRGAGACDSDTYITKSKQASLHNLEGRLCGLNLF
ncbi:hypothetical protein SAMN02910298_02925 [Pseudobutyrivibrio sp. YE44]|uniref:hypothetical protein n=1 Tax=Pseudobutyrivibrio sp. YE44 TaxID=1520802 RepID=UPI000883FBF3|nr:hypothetical protein [Pseudobutyrivibrio sp. YE44]SDB56655.1 hypothetical protein SAMN02910298_02925 [Pseudobutyrivibrio sp. YE44]